MCPRLWPNLSFDTFGRIFIHLAFNANITQHGVLLPFPGFSQNYEPANRPRQISLLLHQPRILFGAYHLFPTLKEGPRNIMASGSQFWSSQS